MHEAAPHPKWNTCSRIFNSNPSWCWKKWYKMVWSTNLLWYSDTLRSKNWQDSWAMGRNGRCWCPQELQPEKTTRCNELQVFLGSLHLPCASTSPNWEWICRVYYSILLVFRANQYIGLARWSRLAQKGDSIAGDPCLIRSPIPAGPTPLFSTWPYLAPIWNILKRCQKQTMSGISHDKLLPVLAQTDVPLESSIAVLSSSESRALNCYHPNHNRVPSTQFLVNSLGSRPLGQWDPYHSASASGWLRWLFDTSWQ